MDPPKPDTESTQVRISDNHGSHWPLGVDHLECLAPPQEATTTSWCSGAVWSSVGLMQTNLPAAGVLFGSLYRPFQTSISSERNLLN